MSEAIASFIPTRKPVLGSSWEYEIFPEVPTIRTIIQLVAWKYGLEYRQLLDQSRRAEVVRARYLAIHAAYRLTGASMHVLAREFRRCRTTVSYALERRDGRYPSVFLHSYNGRLFAQEVKDILAEFQKGAIGAHK